MTLKTFKPYTKSTRGTVLIDNLGFGKENPTSLLHRLTDLQKVEITLVELPQETTVVVINTSIELLIFIGIKLVLKVWLKGLNMILIDLVT